jgi:hypothetical protein
LSEATIHDTLKVLAHAERESDVDRYPGNWDQVAVPVRRGDVPQPRTPPIPMAQTMAHGTAVAAFEASSEIWTVESNEPARYWDIRLYDH